MKAESHAWKFKKQFRRNAFGWRSQPAIARVRQAVSEIKTVAKKSPVLAAEGAVSLLERLSPALAHVDSSSGSMGTAVGKAITDLVPIIASAPADEKVRDRWLDRLDRASQEDEIPYIEDLGDYWGELCASETVASAWADRLIEDARMGLHPDRGQRIRFHGITMCLGALYSSRRFSEIVDLIEERNIWAYNRWAVRALVAQGNKSEALRRAEACRGQWAGDSEVDSACEEILLSSGMTDEAYSRYGIRAHQRGTYLATFRAVTRTYPDKQAAQILADLVTTTPGEEGKWFAAAKDVGLYDEAIELARRSPCDPRTLSRAARDYAEERPAFAIAAGLLALHWIAAGYGYEITSDDVRDAYRPTIDAADRAGSTDIKDRIRAQFTTDAPAADFVERALARELEK